LKLISIAHIQESRVDDKTDLANLIAPVKDRMFATVWRILRHPQDAEDALQNALVTIWRRRTQIESHPAPHALILRICADAAIDHFRRRRLNHVDVSPLEEQLPALDLSPLDELIKDETLDLVMEAIAGLSPKQSVAIVMKYILAESHATIAEALGCTTETVREHLARGRERLGQVLGHLEPDRLPTKITTPFSQENER
jgi:RNA polymerase sigma-70 factor, ECF subfamily